MWGERERERERERETEPKADVILVDSIARRIHSGERLAAALLGKRLAGSGWLTDRRDSAEHCVSYKATLFQRLLLYMSGPMSLLGLRPWSCT